MIWQKINKFTTVAGKQKRKYRTVDSEFRSDENNPVFNVVEKNPKLRRRHFETFSSPKVQIPMTRLLPPSA